MAEFQNTIDLLGDEVVARKIVDRTIEEFTDDGLKKIAESAFYKCTMLTRIELPNATEFGSSAFGGCSKLKNVSAPLITSIGSTAFGDSGVEEIDFPLLRNAGSQTYRYCKSLKRVNLPLVSAVGYSEFQGCRALTSVNVPLARTIGNYAFVGCGALTSIDLPAASQIQGDNFGGAFRLCQKLAVVILRNKTVCSLSGIEAFSYTPFYTDGTGGTVYVPQALIEQYQNATNWSTLYAEGTCNFVAIEGSEYE